MSWQDTIKNDPSGWQSTIRDEEDGPPAPNAEQQFFSDYKNTANEAENNPSVLSRMVARFKASGMEDQMRNPTTPGGVPFSPEEMERRSDATSSGNRLSPFAVAIPAGRLGEIASWAKGLEPDEADMARGVQQELLSKESTKASVGDLAKKLGGGAAGLFGAKEAASKLGIDLSPKDAGMAAYLGVQQVPQLFPATNAVIQYLEQPDSDAIQRRLQSSK